MKLGIFVTNQNPLGSDMVSNLEDQYVMTRLARDRGWDAVATGQHYLSEGMSQLQLIPFLARLAAEAGEMTGVAGVLLINLHNPVEVAECIASLDVIWRGNFVFGVGLGYREVEFDAFKVPKGQRLRRFEECLEIVKRLWTEDKVSVETDVCTLANVTLTCRPVQKPHPPIWFAANSDAAVRRAARLGDTWFVNPHATMASIARQMGLYREELGRLGKPLPACGRSSRRSTARRIGGQRWNWPDHISARSTAPTRRGARTRCYPTVTPSASRSRSCSATGSCWAARRNATSSCARAGKRSARTSCSSARTGSACRWPT